MKSIIYIERNNLYFYGSNVHAPIAFPFQPTVVRDIEVINPEELTIQLNDFIKNNKIEPSESIIIVSHQSSFEKSLPPKTDPAVIDSERKKFLDNVPFGQILSQTLTNEKGTKIIAVNKELTYLIRDIFNNHQFQIESISSIAPISPDNDISFTAESAQQILKKASILKQNSLPVIEVEAPITDTFEEGFVHEKKNTNLYIMLLVLFVGIGVLVFMLINQQSARKNKKIGISPTPRVSARVSTPSPTLVPTTTSASPSATLIPKETLTFQILNGSGVAGQAEEIKEQLEKAGYKNINTGNSPTTQSSNSLIIYKSSVLQTQREEISDVVSEIAGSVAVQVNNEIDVDVLITTSRRT